MYAACSETPICRIVQLYKNKFNIIIIIIYVLLFLFYGIVVGVVDGVIDGVIYGVSDMHWRHDDDTATYAERICPELIICYLTGKWLFLFLSDLSIR